jgi:hypothetical protein
MTAAKLSFSLKMNQSEISTWDAVWNANDVGAFKTKRTPGRRSFEVLDAR